MLALAYNYSYCPYFFTCATSVSGRMAISYVAAQSNAAIFFGSEGVCIRQVPLYDNILNPEFNMAGWKHGGN